jgi:hypothetical protein
MARRKVIITLAKCAHCPRETLLLESNPSSNSRFGGGGLRLTDHKCQGRWNMLRSFECEFDDRDIKDADLSSHIAGAGK